MRSTNPDGSLRYPTEFGPASRSRKKAAQVLFYGYGRAARHTRADRGLPDVPGASGKRTPWKSPSQRPKFEPRPVCRAVVKGKQCGGSHKTRAHKLGRTIPATAQERRQKTYLKPDV